jgi:hypothetical protein
MNAPARLAALLLTAGALLLAVPSPLPAADLETLYPGSFSVRLDAAGGKTVVDVTFALALSEISSYPVTITAVGASAEEVLYEGSLQAGVYRLRAPLTKATPSGLKVVLKTRVTNRSEKANATYVVYQKWENR